MYNCEDEFLFNTHNEQNNSVTIIHHKRYKKQTNLFF
jgi:hypothetical protein